MKKGSEKDTNFKIFQARIKKKKLGNKNLFTQLPLRHEAMIHNGANWYLETALTQSKSCSSAIHCNLGKVNKKWLISKLSLNI